MICGRHRIHRFFFLTENLTPLGCYIHGFHPSPYSSPTTRGLHSLRRTNKKKPNNPFRRNKKEPDTAPNEHMRDVVANIYRLLKYSTWDSARDHLRKLPIKWDSYTVNQVLKTHPPMEKAWLFFNWVSGIRGFKHDQFTYTTMVDIFGEAGRISSMKHVFQKMKDQGIKVDSITYTSLMHWISKHEGMDEAMKVWEEMKCNGCYPTLVSYTAYLKILFDNCRVKEATDIYKDMLQCGYSPNCHTYTILMEYLVGSGKIREALEIFEKMQDAGVQPDKAACNILIERCCGCGETAAMTHILKYMKENRLVLRYPVFEKAFNAFKIACENDAILRQLHPHFSVECIGKDEAKESLETVADSTLTIDRELLLILLRKKSLIGVDHLLAGLISKNIQLDNEIISEIIEVNCSCGRPDGALLAFDYAVKMGENIERSAYFALIGILMRSNIFEKVVEVVEKMIKAGHSLGVYLGALLIYRLGCARTTFAGKIFNLLPNDHKGTATYTALMSVYFSAGSVKKALIIYKSMRKKGVSPALGTYSVLLCGLERSGRSSEVEVFRKEKRNLLASMHSRETVPLEEKICNFLFATDVDLLRH